MSHSDDDMPSLAEISDSDESNPAPPELRAPVMRFYPTPAHVHHGIVTDLMDGRSVVVGDIVTAENGVRDCLGPNRGKLVLTLLGVSIVIELCMVAIMVACYLMCLYKTTPRLA
ncbi:hypothetical protein SISNIDRAFT_491893 [Sistotremastrum niveocremeum HHB9708]|uniref:Uncharacterized protein n=1 Tax=Sistotremastrum niveocremeum HHB9708 TaxID=1314777 RepID=A0A164M9Z7_9AGAM|nr:hypothetical protein SISNIDRAFT_491893 [Sistotremastrum niveocremeum HHB9708]